MSLMNVYVEPTRAYAVIDTASEIVDEPSARFESWKCTIDPVRQVFITHVGRGVLSEGLRRGLWEPTVCRSVPARFDDLVEVSQGILRGLLDTMGPKEPSGALNTSLVLVAWSPEDDSMRSVAFDCKDALGEGYRVETIDVPRGCVNPAIPGDPFRFAGLESMVSYARRQVGYAREAFPGAACGGRLIAITMDETSIQVQHCGPAS